MSSERRDSDSFKFTEGVRVPHSKREQFPKTNYHPASAGPLNEFEQEVYKIFLEARNLLLSKHKDYGPTNIANAPGGALNGLRVRMHDKTARINHLIDNAKYKNPEHESLRDSFLDLANYAMIALLVIDGNWPTSDDDDTEADCG